MTERVMKFCRNFSLWCQLTGSRKRRRIERLMFPPCFIETWQDRETSQQQDFQVLTLTMIGLDSRLELNNCLICQIKYLGEEMWTIRAEFLLMRFRQIHLNIYGWMLICQLRVTKGHYLHSSFLRWWSKRSSLVWLGNPEQNFPRMLGFHEEKSRWMKSRINSKIWIKPEESSPDPLTHCSTNTSD